MGLRAPIRLALLVAVTPPLYVGWVLTRPISWAAPRTDRHLQKLWVGTWARATLWIMGVRARYEGPVPDGSYFLVANHLSYVDIPLLLARLDARFIAKAEIARWPIMGFLARSTGTLFIDRTRKRDLTRVLGEVKSLLDRGPGVIVFPEATSTDGSQIERFKPSLFEVPAEVEVPIRCAALHYHSPDGPLPAWQAVCWWGDAPFGPHFLQFLSQRRTDATVTFSAEIPTLSSSVGPARRKELSAAAQVAVERSFRPTRPIEEQDSKDPDAQVGPMSHPVVVATSPGDFPTDSPPSPAPPTGAHPTTSP